MATIILSHQHARGQVGCPEIRINGRVVPARHYTIIDHIVALDGEDDIVGHDAATLLELGFTLAHPRQQEEYLSRRRSAGMICETREGDKKIGVRGKGH